MSPHADVLIVGGGVIGLTTAYFLAREGMNVEVLDKGALGMEASWAGAGIIPPGNPEHAASGYDQLRATSSRMYPDLSAQLRETTGIDNGYRVNGGIDFLDPDDDETVALWQAEGVQYHPFDEKRLSTLEAAVVPRPAAYFLPEMAQVRNPRHLRALEAACRFSKVALRPETPVQRLEWNGSTIVGVRLSTGESRTAKHYLVAAGAWAETLLEPLGLRSGIVPVLGQIVLLKTKPGMLERTLLVGKNYLVPRDDGHILIGATEEPEAGFQKRNTAEAVADLIAFARSLIPDLAGAEVVKCWAGLRPASGDGLPSIGRCGDFRNLYLAGGHYRGGIQLSPATALVMTELLTGRQPTVSIDAFLPGRKPGNCLRTAFRS